MSEQTQIKILKETLEAIRRSPYASATIQTIARHALSDVYALAATAEPSLPPPTRPAPPMPAIKPPKPAGQPKFDPRYVHQMWATVRQHDSVIPSEVLDAMREVLMHVAPEEPVTEKCNRCDGRGWLTRMSSSNDCDECTGTGKFQDEPEQVSANRYISDTERLDFMETHWTVLRTNSDGFWVFLPTKTNGYYTPVFATPREAIDAAIAKSKEAK